MATRKVSKIRAPQKAKDRPATAADYEKLFLKMEREKKAVLPKGFLQESEEAIQADWCRRAALAFLARPFKEMTDKLKENRDTAVAFAALASRLPTSIKRYEAVIDVLETAKLRIDMALCVREDMPAVLKEAGHE